MITLEEKIESSKFIYSSYTKWGLKKYICNIKYFTEEPLDDLYFVICSIIDSTDNKHYDKRALGILLGFSMLNQYFDKEHRLYYDVAEVRIFEDILTKVEKEHLIKIVENDIFLTELGSISLKEGKHYQFFEGTQELYEHYMLKSQMPTAMLMFPFFQDMGIYTNINTKNRIWPEEADIVNIVYYKKDQLKKRLEYQSKDKTNIYSAELQDYFDIEIKKIPVKLFKYKDEYIPVVMNNESLAMRATKLVCEESNSCRKENIVLECLFQKLWDDKTATLNYDVLEPYFELVDYEELTKDSRTNWNDSKLFYNIIDNATATCWKNITRYCELSVLCEKVGVYKDYLDWAILSERIDDLFLINNFKCYPWDLEIISEDLSRKDSVIEQLILQQKETEEDWNWDELGKRLSSDFVLSHLEVVKIDLASYTKDSESVRKAIIANSDKRWDWDKVERNFNLQFILDNIEILGPHLGFEQLFDRIFTDSEWANKFVNNFLFKNVVSQVSKEGGALSTSVFNDKKFLWTNETIDFLSSNELVCWQSTPYMIGLECNPYLVWSKPFFDRYSQNVKTDEGHKYVSSNIKDINIIIDAPDYAWDWNAISSNINILSEKQLYAKFGKKLNWNIVFTNQHDASFLQSIDSIEVMIGNNKEAWSTFSSIASIDYVITKYKDYKFPWDWSVLTERMFPKLKLENLGNKLFVDHWDWAYLSKYIDINFLNSHLNDFSKYWKWEIILPRILTDENRFDYNFLDQLAVILTNIPEKNLSQIAWMSLTSQYSFKELKKLIKDTVCKRAYWWDINYFCQHKEFYVFRDLEEFRNIVDWNALSSSVSVDNSFKFDPKLGIKEKAWHVEVRKVLGDNRNRWNFMLLSHFESLRDERWFITQFKDKIDWKYISQSSKIFCVRDRQKLNEVIDEYKAYINFEIFSERNDIDIEQIIKIVPDECYDYNSLIKRGVVKATFQFIEKKNNYAWDWQLITSSKSFYPNSQFLLDHINCDINWNALSLQENDKVWSDEYLIKILAHKEAICHQLDFFALSSLECFPIKKEILEIIPIDELNWKFLSNRKEIIPIMDYYLDFIDWRILSKSPNINPVDINFLKKYEEYINWDIVCGRNDFVYSNEIIDLFADYIDWNLASDSKDIKFSKQLVEKYVDRWNWPVLVKNKAFNNIVDISDMTYVKKINIVEFISKFPKTPKAYHFTHMANAIKIIRAMKLQSRNNADGNFSNSAGTNVHRTNKAHRFARFYFLPKSPTQFYNECLGKDIDDRKYYGKALNLGLPKCPLPVFFVFDIEELLTVFPDLCYYSNGNMQKDSSRCFKVVEEPNRIKAKEIYINSYEYFDERQQEFLIEGELDFSKLKNVQISCFDEYQAEMLRKELEGTKFKDLVSTDSSLYEHCNKELYYKDDKDILSISSNYKSPFELRVSYAGNKTPSIINKNNIIRQRGNNIFVSSSVEIRKDTPFEVYFEVHNPRDGSWLIYKNK